MERVEAERELERFRQQWREEVSAKTKTRESKSSRIQASSSGSDISKKNVIRPPIEARGYSKGSVDGADELEPINHQDLPEQEIGRKSGIAEYETKIYQGPTTALDHYEKAVEREGQGSLGDSVALYRKAFRMDPDVQDLFKKKHYSAPSASKTKTLDPNPSNAPVIVPSTAHHSLTALPPTVSELIADFTGLSIAKAPPPTDLSPAPACHIAEIPDEILTHILLTLATMDVASFARTAQVCKRLAYLVLTEESIWKRIVHGHEYGFQGMHYTYACTEDGDPISAFSLDDSNTEFSLIDTSPFVQDPTTQIPQMISLSPQYPSYRNMFRNRPRIRFQGCYISTVNYARPGHANSMRWNTPILIVTYYRYLRFYRDGTALSLLTTHEPTDVVPYLTREHLNREATNLPHGVMRDAVGGRWRLGGNPFDPPEADAVPNGSVLKTHEDGALPEGHLHIETPGVVPKYMYKMHLSLLSTGKSGPRNNKLAWVGYWSKNRLTDDWGEFELKNDKAFYWSRVKSWVDA